MWEQLLRSGWKIRVAWVSREKDTEADQFIKRQRDELKRCPETLPYSNKLGNIEKDSELTVVLREPRLSNDPWVNVQATVRHFRKVMPHGMWPVETRKVLSSRNCADHRDKEEYEMVYDCCDCFQKPGEFNLLDPKVGALHDVPESTRCTMAARLFIAETVLPMMNAAQNKEKQLLALCRYALQKLNEFDVLEASSATSISVDMWKKSCGMLVLLLDPTTGTEFEDCYFY